jgi:hypothetical protein
MIVKRTGARHVFANTLGGLFVGIGVSLMVTLYGVVGWSSAMPDLIVVLGIVLGLGIGLLPVRTIRESTPKKAQSDYSSLRS